MGYFAIWDLPSLVYWSPLYNRPCVLLKLPLLRLYCGIISAIPFMCGKIYVFNPYALMYVWQIEDIFEDRKGGFKTVFFSSLLIFDFSLLLPLFY